MYGIGKSDRPIVPGKPSNESMGAPIAAEEVEERGLAKGNSLQHSQNRTQSREPLTVVLTRIRQVTRRRQYGRPTVPGISELDVGNATLAEAIGHGRLLHHQQRISDFSRSTRPTPARLTRGRSPVR